jgi:cytochrome c peroxidase
MKRRLFVLAVLLASPVASASDWPTLSRYERMVIPADNPMTEAKVELGKQLFFDPRLSGDGSTACISCHRPDHGLTDGRPKSIGAYGEIQDRACPTLWNVGYQQAFYWEGAGASLEEAISGVWRFILAPGKDGTPTMADVAARLGGIAAYRAAFDRTFGAPPDVENVPRALAAFLRTLVASRSAWARFQDGDTRALSARARRGWEVFDRRAGCTQCHNGALLTDLQYHNVGIAQAKAKPESGRFAMTRLERDRGAFKTPTLLDVGRTPPYFHDGSVATLEAAVDVMATGGLANPHKDQALRDVKLTRAERAALLAFLRELTVDVRIEPPVLPE